MARPGTETEQVAVKEVQTNDQNLVAAVQQEALMLTELQGVADQSCLPHYYGLHLPSAEPSDGPAYIIMGYA